MCALYAAKLSCQIEPSAIVFWKMFKLPRWHHDSALTWRIEPDAIMLRVASHSEDCPLHIITRHEVHEGAMKGARALKP